MVVAAAVVVRARGLRSSKLRFPAPIAAVAVAADLPPETEEPVPPRDTLLSHILAAFARKISHRRDAPVADTNYRGYRSYRGYVTEAAISRAPASRT